MQPINNQKPSRASHSRTARFRLRFALALPILLALHPAARAQNVEDEAIPDDVPAAVPDAPAASTLGAPAQAVPDQAVPDQAVPAPRPAASVAPDSAPDSSASTSTGAPSSGQAASDSITVPRAVWEKLLRDVDELKRQRAAPGSAPNSAAGSAAGLPNEVPPLSADGSDAGAAEPDAAGSNASGSGGTAEVSGGGASGSSDAGSRNYLLLPDISFIGNVNGALSSDQRQEGRSTLRFTEGEIGIQGQVYPNVAVNAFIVGSPVEDEPFQVEEGYLNFIGLRKNLNVALGRKFVPFGRTGEQHPHSWLYARQLLPRRNLLASENIVGDGALFRYLLPTGKKLFSNLDVGLFNGEGPGQVSSSPFGTESPLGNGASFYDRFYSARLWSSLALSQSQELELGFSHAQGRAQVDDDAGTTLGLGRNTLNGVDLSFRRFMGVNKRLLLRTEYFSSTPTRGLDAAFRRANGYYGLINYRFDQFNDVGLLYENSGFPQLSSNGAREKDLSLIFTRQFTEQFYTRLHLTRGDSPGKGNFNAAFLQFVFGIGPHTHNLE